MHLGSNRVRVVPAGLVGPHTATVNANEVVVRAVVVKSQVQRKNPVAVVYLGRVFGPPDPVEL